MRISDWSSDVCSSDLLSLVIGTRERRPSTWDRLLGIGALMACILLFASSSVQTMLGSAGVTLLASILYRIFGRQDSAARQASSAPVGAAPAALTQPWDVHTPRPIHRALPYNPHHKTATRGYAIVQDRQPTATRGR